MPSRRSLLYFPWSRPLETGAPLETIEDRFPAVFELRRLSYPKFEGLSDPHIYDQGIAGFLDHVQKPNFHAFVEQSEAQTGQRVAQIERTDEAGELRPLDERLLADVDTVVVISFDSFRTAQVASLAEIQAVRRFLEDPDHLIFVCPHHDIGEGIGLGGAELAQQQLAEYLHHGDHGIPPRQGFGGFARSLLDGLGVPVENRYGLRPAALPDGRPEPIEIDRGLDDLGLLEGVESFNLHAHLPQLERIGPSKDRMGVLARQKIDLSAPPHPFTQGGRSTFDALLQSQRATFAGKLLVCDTTMFSSTAGGVENLRRLWTNVNRRPLR